MAKFIERIVDSLGAPQEHDLWLRWKNGNPTISAYDGDEWKEAVGGSGSGGDSSSIPQIILKYNDGNADISQVGQGAMFLIMGNAPTPIEFMLSNGEPINGEGDLIITPVSTLFPEAESHSYLENNGNGWYVYPAEYSDGPAKMYDTFLLTYNSREDSSEKYMSSFLLIVHSERQI